MNKEKQIFIPDAKTVVIASFEISLSQVLFRQNYLKRLIIQAKTNRKIVPKQ